MTSTRTLHHFVGGQETKGTSTRWGPIWNPATGEQEAEVQLADAADVENAVSVAADAFNSWRNMSLAKRTSIMHAFRDLVYRHSDELTQMVCSEHGKVWDDAKGEIARGLDVVDYACGISELLKGSYSDQVSTDIDTFSYRQPLGVCVGITPFNFPVMVPMWMHPIAIATGNTFILKPSERDPSVSNRIAELYVEAGLPHGVFNVLHGDKTTVDALLNHPDVAAVSFVGSTPVARSVYVKATEQNKRVQALGGAKNHAVVMPDADLEFASAQLISAGYGSAGQRCMAISAIASVGSVGDELIDRLQARASELKIGPGLDRESDMGPVITAEARDRVRSYIESGIEAGAKAVLDGRDSDVPGDGFFVGPTLFDQVGRDMDIYTDEIFGPVLSNVRVDSLDEAIELINSLSYANGAAIFTSSGQAARAFQRDIEVGMVGVNVPIPVPMAYYSFGGWKESLFGDNHIHGPEGILFYTRGKVVTNRWVGLQDRAAGSSRLNFPTAM